MLRLAGVGALALVLACERPLEGASCPCKAGFECCEALDQCFEPAHECIVRQHRERDAGPDDAAESMPSAPKALPQHCNASGFCGARYPFMALSGTRDDDLWAVSQDPTDGEGASLVHFDGTRWDNLPYYANTSSYFVRAVHGGRPGNSWFVGDDAGAALAFQYLDGAWGPVWNFGELGVLHAVWAVADDDVWTAGEAGAVARWSGSGWTNQVVPTTATLHALHGSGPDDVWFAGEAGAVLHYTRGAFRLEPSPRSVKLSAVLARASDDVWFAGDDATLLHYDGTMLRAVDPGIPSANLDFTTLAGDGDRLVIGRSDGRFIELRDGRFALMNERLRSGVRGLWLSPERVLWAVGEIGDSLRLSSSELTASPAPIDDHLYDVWGAAEDDVWAVGESGTMLLGDGVGFTAIAPVTRDTLYALDGTDAKDVWAVGASAMLHFDGVTWKKVGDSPSPLRDVRALSANSAWAVGDEGLIMRWDGTAFREFQRWPGLSLRTVWGVAENDVWAFDAHDACLRWDGSTWREEGTFGPGLNDLRVDQVAVGSAQDDMWLLKTHESEGTLYLDSALYMGVTFEQREAVPWYTTIRRGWPSGRRDFWLVGDGFWHFSAGEMDARYAYFGLDWPLHGVWADGLKVWAVGEHGVILHYEPPVYADVGSIGE